MFYGGYVIINKNIVSDCGVKSYFFDVAVKVTHKLKCRRRFSNEKETAYIHNGGNERCFRVQSCGLQRRQRHAYAYLFGAMVA